LLVGLQQELYRIDEIVFRFKSIEELYPFPPLGVDSADTGQLPKEKNLHGYFQITQPGSAHLCTNRGGFCDEFSDQKFKNSSQDFY
jgi:hypothetical protein